MPSKRSGGLRPGRCPVIEDALIEETAVGLNACRRLSRCQEIEMAGRWEVEVLYGV